MCTSLPRALLASLALACGGHADEPVPQPAAAADGSAGARTDGGRTDGGAGKTFVEGEDYLVLQRVRALDPTGFAQPVEAYSLLLPKGWTSEGGISWLVGNPCTSEIVANRFTARAPDGRMQLDFFPIRSWQWNDSPMMLQQLRANQQSYARSCEVLPPVDAAQYLEQAFAPELGARVLSVERADELSRIMEEKARQNAAAMQSAGLQNVQYRPSAVLGSLRFADGAAGLALCAVNQTVFHMQDFLNGGTIASYQCQADVKVALRFPQEQEPQARKLLATAMSSLRINPDWQAAVSQVFMNIGRVTQQEQAKRAAIRQQTQAEISAIQQRTWEDGQASRDRMHTAWGQTIRGVDPWVDPSGAQIELSAGYDEAWSRADGTYILSNDPNFDPNVVLQEDWKKLEKSR